MSAYTIGELARRAGLTVRTVRYYSDIGVLPEHGRTSGGFRLYSDDDLDRLRIVRTLRDLGLDLATIRSVIDQQTAFAVAVDRQLETVEVQIRSLQRVRAVLRAAQQGGGAGRPDDNGVDGGAELRWLHSVMQLDSRAIARLIEDFFDAIAAEIPAAAPWLARLREASVSGLRDEPTPEQLDALLELARLLDDEDFRARLEEMGREFWAGGPGAAARRADHEGIVEAVVAARAAGIEPHSPQAEPVLAEFVSFNAAMLGREDDTCFRADLMRRLDEHDLRAERYWELISVLNGWPAPSQTPQAKAYAWLGEALRHRAR